MEIAFHRAHGKQATITAVRPAARFGGLSLEGNQITAFQEKPEGEGGWINGGFFVLSPTVIGEIADESTAFEREPIQSLTAKGEVQAYFHSGFHCAPRSRP